MNNQAQNKGEKVGKLSASNVLKIPKLRRKNKKQKHSKSTSTPIPNITDPHSNTNQTQRPKNLST